MAGKTVASLGTSGIVAKGEQGQDQFSGSYVWYGSAVQPLRFRVLANGTNALTDTDKAMLLDCDTVPYKKV